MCSVRCAQTRENRRHTLLAAGGRQNTSPRRRRFVVRRLLSWPQLTEPRQSRGIGFRGGPGPEPHRPWQVESSYRTANTGETLHRRCCPAGGPSLPKER